MASNKVKTWFNRTKSDSKGFNAELKRMSQTAGRLATTLGKMAIAGISAIGALASRAPAVAPALAKMKLEFDKIIRNLGEALAPAFERVAGWLGKLATWVGENKQTISDIANRFLDWGEKIGKALWPWLEKLAIGRLIILIFLLEYLLVSLLLQQQ
jgi:hypothetical protein